MDGGVHDGIGARPPGGSESLRKILTMPPHGRRANSTVPPPCPALAGTVASGQSPILSGNDPITSCSPPPLASREAEPPSGGHRRPPGGSESLHKILTMPPHGRRACSTVPPPCPALTGTVVSGQSPILAGNAPIPSCTPLTMASREPEPPSGGHRRPPGGSESLRKILSMPPHDGIGALPDGIGICPLATMPAGLGTVGRVAARAGASSEFYEVSSSRRVRPPGGRWWPPMGGSASLDAVGGGVHDGIGAMPPSE